MQEEPCKDGACCPALAMPEIDQLTTKVLPRAAHGSCPTLRLKRPVLDRVLLPDGLDCCQLVAAVSRQ